jgi:putative ABC transport system permease protein
MDTIADVSDPPMTLGDRITFRIQGVPLTATITSIRSRERESLKPFFYFLFPQSVLQEAPHTFFAALRLEKKQIAQLRNRMVTAFPNITVIDVTESAATIAAVLKRLSNIVRFFTFFSVFAGVLLILSSVYATRFARIREAVYYKVLGARGRFVLSVFTMENMFIGLISGLLALLFSQTGTWIVCKMFLNIPHLPLIGASLMLLALSVCLALAAGLIPSMSIIRQKPMRFLQAQTDE